MEILTKLPKYGQNQKSMNKIDGITKEGNNLLVNGVIDSDNVMAVIEEGRKHIEQCEQKIPINISLQGLKCHNSIQLSFILCLLRIAKKQDKEITLDNIPSSTENMINVHNLRSILQRYYR